ncbi:putative F-box/FBD/LRR-repeat protein At4g13965 [Humulus lupulus]|uniref:putative F-box/FBD/LRR-repeat protein At4g13965 n=1 Tax=Humulus lupulus TaxID=3486 RepID=UPI002B40EFB9|nr:putative F-box/FBD/LRR-repeat protein At4g13965 [Humulus lupulus]
MADEDRISKLPDTVIVHILSFLPTVDVVRTCILSRRWKFMWFSVPTLSFSDTSADFQSPDGLEKFYKYVDDCLEHRRRIMYYFVDSNKVKEINLCLSFSCEDGVNYYWLPETVVNARGLTILELEGLDLDATYSIGLPALKTLSMKNFFFLSIGKVDLVSKFLLGCPSLEKLMLDLGGNMGSIGDLRLQSSSLKFIKIENDGSAYAVPFQVEAINLESLVLNGPIFEISNLSTCKAIRNLSLTFNSSITIKDPSSLEYLISNLPLLEDLTLENCYELKLEHIKILNQQLKSFHLKNKDAKYDHGMNIIIESAPKLTTFCYEGNVNLSISTKSSNLLNGKFVISNLHENYDPNWFTSMMIFLLNLNCSWNIVTLHVHSDKDLILSENFKKICRSPLLNWKHLRVITDKPERESNLKDSLMWISPSLETLSINGKVIL